MMEKGKGLDLKCDRVRKQPKKRQVNLVGEAMFWIMVIDLEDQNH